MILSLMFHKQSGTDIFAKKIFSSILTVIKLSKSHKKWFYLYLKHEMATLQSRKYVFFCNFAAKCEI